MTTAKKNPGLSARSHAISAAVAASEHRKGTPAETDEAVKGISLRLPVATWRRVSRLSFDRKQERVTVERRRDEADSDSIHGIILAALEKYLDEEGA